MAGLSAIIAARLQPCSSESRSSQNMQNIPKMHTLLAPASLQANHISAWSGSKDKTLPSGRDASACNQIILWHINVSLIANMLYLSNILLGYGAITLVNKPCSLTGPEGCREWRDCRRSSRPDSNHALLSPEALRICINIPKMPTLLAPASLQANHISAWSGSKGKMLPSGRDASIYKLKLSSTI